MQRDLKVGSRWTKPRKTRRPRVRRFPISRHCRATWPASSRKPARRPRPISSPLSSARPIGLRRRGRRGRQDAWPRRGIVARRSAEGDRGAGPPRHPVLRSLGRDAEARPGRAAEPVAEPEPKDSRFKDPEWSENPVFDFLKQAYLITTRWAEDWSTAPRGSTTTPAQGALLPQADLGRAVAVELPADQSRTDPRDHQGERRQPRARHDDAGGGHRGRQRRAAGSARPIRAASRSASTSPTRPARWSSATI